MNVPKIVDEMCDCGHKKSEHSMQGHLEKGHGACYECNCAQFTWIDFVYDE